MHHCHSCLRAAVVCEPGCSQNHPLPEPGLRLGSGAWKAVVEAIPAQPEPQNCFWGHGKRSWAAGRAEGRGWAAGSPGARDASCPAVGTRAELLGSGWAGAPALGTGRVLATTEEPEKQGNTTYIKKAFVRWGTGPAASTGTSRGTGTSCDPMARGSRAPWPQHVGPGWGDITGVPEDPDGCRGMPGSEGKGLGAPGHGWAGCEGG